MREGERGAACGATCTTRPCAAGRELGGPWFPRLLWLSFAFSRACWQKACCKWPSGEASACSVSGVAVWRLRFRWRWSKEALFPPWRSVSCKLVVSLIVATRVKWTQFARRKPSFLLQFCRWHAGSLSTKVVPRSSLSTFRPALSTLMHWCQAVPTYSWWLLRSHNSWTLYDLISTISWADTGDSHGYSNFPCTFDEVNVVLHEVRDRSLKLRFVAATIIPTNYEDDAF